MCDKHIHYNQLKFLLKKLNLDLYFENLALFGICAFYNVLQIKSR